MTFRHINQLHQLKRLNPQAHARATQLVKIGHLEKAAAVIIFATQAANDRLVAEREAEEMAKHEANHIFEGFAHAPGDGGLTKEDFDGPLPNEYMRMLEQEMNRRSRVDENRQPKNVGDDISRMLDQPIQAEEDSKIEITEAQKATGLAFALGNQQLKKAKGTIPATW